MVLSLARSPASAWRKLPASSSYPQAHVWHGSSPQHSGQSMVRTFCPPWLCQLFRQTVAAELNSKKPCPSLLQPASMLWQPHGSHEESLESPGICSNPRQPLLPPLPESQASSLRQQARRATLHLMPREEGQKDDEEEEEQQDDKQQQNDDEIAANQSCQIPAYLKVSCQAACARIYL